MLGIISITKEKTNISLSNCAGVQILNLRVKKTNQAVRRIKKLKEAGVTCVALSPQMSELKKVIDKHGLRTVCGDELKKRMAASFAVEAVKNEGIDYSDLAVEIQCGGRGAFDALELWSSRVRYISVIGRGAQQICKRAEDKLGISVICGRLPSGLSENILRLYFNGGETLFSIQTEHDEKKFSDGEILLPRKYSGICPAEHESAVAQFLVEKGIINITELKSGKVFLK